MDKRKKALLYLVAASVLWSTGGLLIKLVSLSPLAIAGGRSGVSPLMIFFYIRIKGEKVSFPKGKDLTGPLCYASTVILFVTANKMTTAANVILLQYTAPVWVALISLFFLKEKIGRLDWGAISLVMAGMVLFFMGDVTGGQFTGNVLSVLSGVALAGVILSLKSYRGSPLAVPLYGNLLTFLVCIPFYFQTVPDRTSLIALILLGTVQLGAAYIFFTEGSRHVSAIEAVLVAVIEPLINPLWVFLFDREAPSLYAVAGGVIVISAVLARSVILEKRKSRPVVPAGGN